MMLEKLIGVIRSTRFSLGSESKLQEEIESVLTKAGIPYEREFILDKKNRPDFMIDGYAVEVKIGARHTNRESAVSIYKQCERYASFQNVKGIVLMSNRPMGFPEQINGKPAYFVGLGGSWL